ncbi:hypothetical protein Ancab_028642 [Ancistrocladus abbreviatus]
MTLEDFFTLTEMKDGLTAPARVAELVTVMQNEKNCIVKNIGDATRQWSTVASTIAATENKDCLDLFIQLDGLWFIDKWLKDAQAFTIDSSDCYVEESILVLLQAFEKLQICKEKLISSGIWVTLKNLLSHKSTKVQERARTLVDRFEPAKDSNAIHLDVEMVGMVCDGETDAGNKLVGGGLICSVVDAPPSEQNIEHHVSETPAHHAIVAGKNDHPAKGVEVGQTIPAYQVGLHKISDDDADSKDACSEAPVSDIKLDPELQAAVMPDGQSSLDPMQGCDEGKSAVLISEISVGEIKQTDGNDNFAEESAEMENSSACMNKPRDFSTHDVEGASASVLKAVGGMASDDSDMSSVKIMLLGDLGNACTSMGKSSSEMDDNRVLQNCSTTLECKSSGQGDECCTQSYEDLADNGFMSDKHEDLETSSRTEDAATLNENKGYTKGGQCRFTHTDVFAKRTGGSSEVLKMSDMDLEYGTVDALEIARLVAVEVERQVGDYDDEQSGSSSSERILRRSIGQSDSMDSMNAKQDLPTGAVTDEMRNLESQCDGECPKVDQPFLSSDKLDTGRDNAVQDMEYSQVIEPAQEPEVRTEKSPCEFDLNQEICFEDEQVIPNLMADPVAVVSASKAAAAPGTPVAPLQFEGTLARKGSATASVFQPASPHRNTDVDRAASGGGTSSDSRQRQESLVIDLNVAEGEDCKVMDPVIGQQSSAVPSLPSVGSSAEPSSGKSKRFKFDLNQTSEDVDWKLDGRLFVPQNGHRSPSPASSSSSMRLSMRNFDLNDKPSNYGDLLEPQPFIGEKSDDSVISIMGAAVRKNIFPRQGLHYSPNGVAAEPVVDINLARAGHLFGSATAVPYAHSSLYGYNGFATGPIMPSSFPVYGPSSSIPYMVDSRGAPIVPQIMGSMSFVPPSPSQSSLVMNPAGSLPGSHVAGPSRPNLDLNSGYVVDGVNCDPGVSRQLFVPGQARSLGDQSRENVQSSCSGVGVKRKEPDGGWEPYFTNYKHHEPPQL